MTVAGPEAEFVPPLQRPEFRKLLAISITIALGFGLIIPILPRYARSFGVGLAAVGLTQVVFGFTRFSFGLVGGVIVDRFGERVSVVIGILIVSASSYAAGLADTFPQLVVARGLGGAGSALFISGLMNRIVRIIEPAAMGRATGAFRSSFLIGIGIGPLFGGLMGERLGFSTTFYVYATGLLFAAAIAWFVMAEVPGGVRAPRRSMVESLRTARPLFRDIRYTVAMLATFIGWWTIGGPAQTVGVVYADEQLGLSSFQIGLAVTMLAVGELLVLLIAGRAADRRGRRAVMIPALLVMGVATLLLGQIQDLSWAYFPLMVAIGGGIAASSAAAGGLIGDSLPREGSGAAVGLNQMAGDLGYLAAPVTVGALAESAGFSAAYILAALPAFAILLVALRLPSQPVRPSPGEIVVEPAEPVG
jgi:MFS family permease